MRQLILFCVTFLHCAYGSQRFISADAKEEIYASCKFKGDCLTWVGDECPNGYQVVKDFELRDDGRKAVEIIVQCFSNKHVLWHI